MGDQKIGDLLDSLGVIADISDGDIVPSAVILLKSVDEDGRVGLVLAYSEGMTWLDQLGMIEAAKQIVTLAGYSKGDDDG